MSDTETPPLSSSAVEKSMPITDVESKFESSEIVEPVRYPLPEPYHIGPLTLPNIKQPYVQVFLAGFTAFLAVGMFGVLSSLGGSGQVDPTIADDANIALYSVFAAVALFSGSIISYLGPKICLAVSGLGYAMYGAAFWSYNNNHNKGFVLFGGVSCGVGAALLWTSCSVVMLTYSTEAQKGRFISILFAVFYLGSTIGGCIPLGENFHNTHKGSVNNGTYAALTILMALSCVSGSLIVNPDKMVRTDGTKPVLEHKPFLDEIKNIWATIKRDPYILLFMPFSFGSLYYGAYQGSDFESYFFNVRTRALDGFLIGLAQVLASLVFGSFLDWNRWRRKTRAYIGWAVLTTFVTAISTCGYFAMKMSNRHKKFDVLDIHSGALATRLIVLEFFFGFQDGLDNALAYYLIGCFSNDPRTVATLTGFFKVFGATGCAIAFGQDINKVPYTGMYGSYFGVILGGVLLLLPLIYLRIHDTEEDPIVVSFGEEIVTEGAIIPRKSRDYHPEPQQESA